MVRIFAYPVICLGLAISAQAASRDGWEISKPQRVGSYTDRGEMDAFVSRLAELCYRKGELLPLNPEIAQRLQIPPAKEVYASTYEGEDGALHSVEEYKESEADPAPQDIFFSVNDGKSVLIYLTDMHENGQPLLVVKAENTNGVWTWDLIPSEQVRDRYKMELNYWKTHQQKLVDEPDQR